jgi:hypothetical protein
MGNAMWRRKSPQGRDRSRENNCSIWQPGIGGLIEFSFSKLERQKDHRKNMKEMLVEKERDVVRWK